jgi:hypothetical protein
MERYLAEMIVEGVLDDLQNRKGLGDALDEIDEITMDEIKEDLIDLVMNT